jgi:hypothetical protein
MNVDDGRIMRSWRSCLFTYAIDNTHLNHSDFFLETLNKFEVNWPGGSQFTARHTKNRLQFDE